MIIFIYGEDTYSSMQHLGSMKNRFKEKFDPSGMNVSEYKNKLDIGLVAQDIQSPGFLSDRRMIIVKGLLETVTRKPDAKPWLEVLQKTPVETIVILFDVGSDKKIEKNELFKQLKKSGSHTYHFPTLSGFGLQKWAAEESKRLNLNIADRELQHVVGLVGSDLWQLTGELKKLAAYSNGNQVTSEMIELLVKANFEDAMFDFVDAVSQRQSARALALLHAQRESGSTDFHLFAMLIRQIRLLLGARDLIDRNERVTKQEIADSLGVHPFVAQKMLAQARGFQYQKLKKLHEQLYLFDREMKSGGVSVDVAVDRIVAEMVV